MSKILTLALLIVIFIVGSLSLRTSVFAQTPMCCIEGYTTGDLACPLGTDQTKQCCRRYGFGQYDVKEKIVCGSTQPSETNLCCPEGFGTGDNDCPFGVDRSKQCCRRYGLGQYQTVDRITCGTKPPPEADLCCPASFSNGDLACPFGIDQTKQCCRKYDFGQYDVVDKLQCSGDTGLTGNYCCPTGYGTSGFDCPAGTDLKTQCCKRVAFGQYEMVSKISCILSPVDSTGTPTIPKLCGTKGNPPCTFAGGEKVRGCTDDPNNPGIATAIGCIHTNPSALVKDILTFAIGISGGLAFLMMLLGVFGMLTSAGNPEALQAGRDKLTNATIGLLFVIFAVLLMQIIGVGILDIPGFDR